MSTRPVPDAPIVPLVTVEADSVTPAFAPVTMMFAAVAAGSALALSVIPSVDDVILTAELVRLAVVIAAAPRLTAPAEACNVTFPASVFTDVTFSVPVVAVYEKSRPVVTMLVSVIVVAFVFVTV